MTRRDSGPDDAGERWHAVRALVDAALQLPTPARFVFLTQATSDLAIHADATRWLDACERSNAAPDFLVHAAAERATPLIDAVDDQRYGQLPDADDEIEMLRRALAHVCEVEHEIGRGGMATVYLARDPRHHRRVAVKVLHPALSAALGAERFLREIEVTASLQHPHILPLFDSGSANGRPYYLMPFVEGETLRARLARGGPLLIPDALRLVREVASALDHAHRHGVVHRDVKPANILLADCHAVVADFGIARAVRRARESAEPSAARRNAGDGALTDAGTSPGTPGYMAPEQARGETDIDHRADLYSLGVVAYEALTGAHPSATRTPLAARRSDCPPALAALIAQLLAEDPEARPASAAAVVSALDAVTDAPQIAVGRPLTRRANIGWGAAVLAVCAAIIVGGLAIGTRERRPAAGTPVATGVRTGRTTHSVAVLPFVNTTGAAGNDFFSDGLTDELAHALAQLPGLRVAGRTSSYAFKGSGVAAPEIGRALGVDALVEGTVRRVGDRLHVTAQIIRAASGTVRWDSSYETRSHDVFAMQDELTHAIVAALATELGAGQRGTSALDVRRGTADEEAYEFYLRGRYYWTQRGTENLARAIAFYRQAIDRDPAFARAYAGLAMAYSILPGFVPDPTDSATALAEANAQRAVALDSMLADAQLARGATLDMRMQFADGLARYRKAIILDPSSVTGHHWLGLSLLNLGRTDEALVELRHSTELDPLAPTPVSAFALALLFARRFPEARSAARRALALDSGFAFALWPLGIAQAFGGQPDSAVQTFENALRLHPEDSRMSANLIFAYAAAGRWSDASRLRAHLKLPGTRRSGWGDVALADLVFGDPSALARLLTTSASQQRYFAAGALFGCNPLLDPIRSDARFRAAMRDLGVQPCALSRPWPLPAGPGVAGVQFPHEPPRIN
jgi:TolB-like protein/tetratricopeptide (TPR) repeat protein/tRNA A-37 threonylcarbamoyl transferase component Bud32